MGEKLPAPGRVLAARYRLETMLGEGGFGTVWRAEHLVLEAPVAVKLIDAEIAHDELARERFLREARAAASLRSPHVVQILDYGIDDEQPFIAMELLEGETLQQRIKRRGHLEAGEVVRILTHVARAVARAHDAGVVHRDLKPENVFLVANDDEEIAKVLDFGVAKVDPTKLGTQSSSTRTGSLLGTPYYMSPEQVLGNKEVDFRSDLWAIGVIAFEALTGSRPFFSDGLGDLVLQITVRPLPVPSQFAPVPPGFDSWWPRAMAREPNARMSSARELVDSLREALDVDAEEVGAVVTVPGPGEDPPVALEAIAKSGQRMAVADAPTRQLDPRPSPTAPTLRDDRVHDQREPGVAGSASVSDQAFTRSSIASASPPVAVPASRRTGLAVGVGLGALVLGLVGGILGLRYLEEGAERPLPETRLLPAASAHSRVSAHPPVRATTTVSAAPSVSVASPMEVASTAPSASASLPEEAEALPSSSSGGGVAPPEEWLPKVVDGKIIKPDWARPDEPEPASPPTPPEYDDNPY